MTEPITDAIVWTQPHYSVQPRKGGDQELTTIPDDITQAVCCLDVCAKDGPNDCQDRFTPENWDATAFTMELRSSHYKVALDCYDSIDIDLTMFYLQIMAQECIPPTSDQQLAQIPSLRSADGFEWVSNPLFNSSMKRIPIERVIYRLPNPLPGDYDPVKYSEVPFKPNRGFGTCSCWQFETYPDKCTTANLKINYETIGKKGKPDDHDMIRFRVRMPNRYSENDPNPQLRYPAGSWRRPLYNAYHDSGWVWSGLRNVRSATFYNDQLQNYVVGSRFGLDPINVDQSAVVPFSGVNDHYYQGKFWDRDIPFGTDPNRVQSLDDLLFEVGGNDAAYYDSTTEDIKYTFDYRGVNGWTTGTRWQDYSLGSNFWEFCNTRMRSGWFGNHERSAMYDHRYAIQRVEYDGWENFDNISFIQDTSEYDIRTGFRRTFSTYSSNPPKIQPQFSFNSRIVNAPTAQDNQNFIDNVNRILGTPIGTWGFQSPRFTGMVPIVDFKFKVSYVDLGKVPKFSVRNNFPTGPDDQFFEFQTTEYSACQTLLGEPTVDGRISTPWASQIKALAFRYFQGVFGGPYATGHTVFKTFGDTGRTMYAEHFAGHFPSAERPKYDWVSQANGNELVLDTCHQFTDREADEMTRVGLLRVRTVNNVFGEYVSPTSTINGVPADPPIYGWPTFLPSFPFDKSYKITPPATDHTWVRTYEG